MYKFRAKSNIVLGALSLLSLLALLAVENGKVNVEQDWYEEKLDAAQLAQTAANHIKSIRLSEGVFIDAVNDPNETALIGQEYTLVTTDRGYIESKLSSTNPNFAAVIVEMLKESDVGEGDNVALALTGSFPGMNISVLAALQTLKLNPIIISSVGSSNWGANDPYFTWLDMEQALFESNIFQAKSVAASIGGGSDIGRGLSPEGRRLIIKAIERNKLELIKEDHLENSIARRMKIYEQKSNGKAIKAFINVGGGIASLGNTINGKIIPSGLTEFLPKSNFPVRGVMIQMGQKAIPILHLLNISRLTEKYGLPDNTIPIPEPGVGEIFVQEKYSIWITSIAAFLLLLCIIFIYSMEKKHHQLGMDVVPLTGGSQNENNNPENALDL